MSQLAVVENGKIIGVLGELHAFEATNKSGKPFRFVALDAEYNKSGKTVTASIDGVSLPVRFSRTSTLAIEAVTTPAPVAVKSAPKMLTSADFQAYLAKAQAAILNA